MIVHEIHDNSNLDLVKFLGRELATITDESIIKNYHPDYRDEPSNIFYILRSGRYRKFYGKYFIVEDDGKIVCSAGWNVYEEDPTIALGLTRAYVSPDYRGQYPMSKYILPKIIEETADYERLWITVNEHNIMIYNWFVRASQNKRTTLFNDWPDIYRQFKPMDKMTIYNTTQYVVELKRKKMTDQEKLEFLENAIRTQFGKSPKVAVTPDASLLDLGLDSLDVVELQMYYEEVHGVETSTDAKVNFVKDLMALMK